MKKNICFIVGALGRDSMYYEIAQKMKKEWDLEDIYLSFTKKSMNYLERRGVNKKKIIYFDINDWKKTKIDLSYLSKAEKKYGNPNLWYIWSAIRITPHNEYEEALKMMQCQIQFLEKLIKKYNPHFVGEAIASIPTLLIDLMSRAHNNRYIQLSMSKVFGEFVLQESITDSWVELERRLKELRKRPLTKKERVDAENYIADFKKKQIIPLQDVMIREKKRVGLTPIKRMFRFIYDHYRYKEKNYRFPSLFPPFIWIFHRIRFILKRKIVDIWNPFERPVKGEKFVLFPLHFQPEATTIIYAPFYKELDYIAKKLAMSIPLGYKLYIKEHPFGYERRKFSYYKEMKEIPNARIIHHREPIHELVRDASMVVTITSTTGYEALLYEKPVLALGNVFYNRCKNVVCAPRMHELPALVTDMLKNYSPDHEELLRFVSALIYASHEGIVLLPEVCENKSLEEGNLQRIGDALGKEFSLPKK